MTRTCLITTMKDGSKAHSPLFFCRSLYYLENPSEVCRTRIMAHDSFIRGSNVEHHSLGHVYATQPHVHSHCQCNCTSRILCCIASLPPLLGKRQAIVPLIVNECHQESCFASPSNHRITVSLPAAHIDGGPLSSQTGLIISGDKGVLLYISMYIGTLKIFGD